MSKLIGDYRSLAPLLRDLDFDAVAFSYPQRARLGSPSLAWSDDSQLVQFTSPEFVAAFDSVNTLRKLFPVNNPSASVADMKRHLRSEREIFPCYGGYKSFYMDWNYDMWRCDAWPSRMCSVDRLASQLKENKSAACRRAIQRILERVKKDYELLSASAIILLNKATSRVVIPSCVRTYFRRSPGFGLLPLL